MECRLHPQPRADLDFLAVRSRRDKLKLFYGAAESWRQDKRCADREILQSEMDGLIYDAELATRLCPLKETLW
jgi:hypothetical protein